MSMKALVKRNGGLDPNERVRVRELIHSVSEGRIVLIATHIVSDVDAGIITGSVIE